VQRRTRPIRDAPARPFNDRHQGGPIPDFEVTFRHHINQAKRHQPIGVAIAAPGDASRPLTQPYGDPVAEVDTQSLGNPPAARVEDES